MMAPYARIITTGKNSTMPKTVYMPFGVGVDGCIFKYPITIKADEVICPDCEGWGTDRHDSNCERCDGDGIITIEQETAAVSRCLPAAAVGRPVSLTVAGRPPSSGMSPDARATGDLSRSVHPPGPALSIAPAASGHLYAIADAITVVSGLFVFGALGYFFLVLA